MEVLFRDFEIKARNKIKFEEKIDKLNSKAIKLNFPTYSFVYGSVKQVNGEVVIPVKLIGVQSIKIDGWEFVATLNHIEDEVLIFSSSDIPIPKTYTVSECEHCNVSRNRKHTYLLFNQEENKYMQVGSTCIQDFFNGNAPENVMKFTDFVAEVRHYIDNLDFVENDSKKVFILENVIALTNATIRDHGWVSKSKAVVKEPTASIVWAALNKSIEPALVTKFDVDETLKIMNWVSSLSDKDLENNYLNNLKSIHSIGFVDEKTIGMACSMVIAYENSKPKIRKESEYFGQVGEKHLIELTFKKCFEFFSKFGTQRIYTFEDENGNAFVWKTTTFKPFEEGNKYIIKGTIKAHNLYKEKYKQTELTRCSIEKLDLGDIQ